MALPSGSTLRVTWNVAPSPTSSASLIPGGSVSVNAPAGPNADDVADAAIKQELENRKTSHQADVDRLAEIQALFPA